MSHIIMLIPIGPSVGLTTVSLGLIRALQRQSVTVNFFKPIAQLSLGGTNVERSIASLRQATNLNPPEPFTLDYAEEKISQGQGDILLEDIVARCSQRCSSDSVVVMEGLVPTERVPWGNRANMDIAKALNADIIFVTTPGSDTTLQLLERVEIYYNNLGGKKNKHLIGAIINKVGAPVDENGRSCHDLNSYDSQIDSQVESVRDSIVKKFKTSQVKLLGCITWNRELITPRVVDLAHHLSAKFLNEGDCNTRRLRSMAFCDHTLNEIISQIKPGGLLITPADRTDIIVSVCLAVMNGMEIGALLLTGGGEIQEKILPLCQPALEKGLPVMIVPFDTWQTAMDLQLFNLDAPTDDLERAEKVQDFAASSLNESWIETLSSRGADDGKLSPAAFRYKLTQLSIEANKCIVLPEGTEPRTIRAASICAVRNIARTILLGAPEEIHTTAERLGIELPSQISIIDPKLVIEKYVPILVRLRKHKGMTEAVARDQLLDNVVLGTLMLQQGEVDGLVSGAEHTTANTIRPALQLIKTAPGHTLVSSVFFMLLPDQVLVYGDCAINPNPTAEQLSEIAYQSALSAKAFSIDPRVAMISYSTGSSGTGSDVDKVRKATTITKSKYPELTVDGPLQYDAAIMENVAKSKAPDSPVAGKATVFIFPDLNTGNTTYKAVQRSADLVSIGPMLQGLNKPVNDLSRGALVEDIVYTIALTAIQAAQVESL